MKDASASASASLESGGGVAEDEDSALVCCVYSDTRISRPVHRLVHEHLVAHECHFKEQEGSKPIYSKRRKTLVRSFA